MATSSAARPPIGTTPRASAAGAGNRNDTDGTARSVVSTPGSAANAAAASIRPDVVDTQLPASGTADEVSAVRIDAADAAGPVEASSAATPDVNGVADEVPQNWPTTPVMLCAGLQPGAARSTQAGP